MKKVKQALRACPECGRKVRASNLARHRRARHMPYSRPRKFGHKITPPAIPIRVGREQDRRYDEVFPRGEGPFRFRIYRLRAGELELIAAAPDPGCMGEALYRMWSEGEFVIDDAAGVLDTKEDPGHWIANPFALGRRKQEEVAI